MAQTGELVRVLKRTLRSHGVTYAQVAEALKLSEASVKRMFASGHFSLERLDAVCRVVNLEFTDLLRMIDESSSQLSELTEEQEQKLVSDPRLLLVAICVRNRWSFADITEKYQLAEPDCTHYLAELDRLGIIELLPGNRIRLRLARDFRWVPGGPIEQFFRDRIEREFLDGSFNKPGDTRVFLTGALTGATMEILQRRLLDLRAEFSRLHQEDCSIPILQRRNVGFFIAMRPYNYSGFLELRRKDKW